MKKSVLFFATLMLCGFTLKAQKTNSPGTAHGLLFAKLINSISGTGEKLCLKNTLDQKYLVDSLYRYYWDSTNLTWNYSYKTKYDYLFDASGNNIGIVDYTPDAIDNSWRFDMKQIYQFNTDGNITEEIDYSWDKTTDTWDSLGKYVYTYDAGGNNIELVGYRWYEINNSWQNLYRYSCTFDADGNNIEMLLDYWDDVMSKWSASNKYIFSYDAAGNLTENISFLWSTTMNDWQNRSKRNYTYDANWNRTGYTEYLWETSASTWQNSKKAEYNYDTNGNMVEHSLYSWGWLTLDWGYLTKEEYAYDAQGNNTEKISYNADITGSALVLYDKYDYFYSLHNSMGLKEQDATDLKIYPNPATNQLRVGNLMPGSAIQVCDLKGVVLIAMLVQSGTVSIDISKLSKGVYIVKVSDRVNIVTRKFVKQ